MAAPDSIRLKKESNQCEVASRLAEFLESHDPNHTYNFVMPDLLEFSCEVTLSRLRESADWQALEAEFKSIRGSIFEDWEGEDDEVDEVTPLLKPQSTPQSTPPALSRSVGLIITIIGISAIAGGLCGWFFPYFDFPILSREARINSQSIGE
jgi:hypothetical protein